VMIAMNGASPVRPVAAGAGVPFPVQPRAALPFEVASVDLVLPDFGPYVPERPVAFARGGGEAPSPALSYADARVRQAAQAVADFADPGAEALVAALNRRYAAAAKAAPASSAGYVAVGTYADEAEAQRLAAHLQTAGRVEIETGPRGEAFTLNLHPAAGRSLDDALQAAWAAGAADAMPVRE